ncbi:hypothetical protein ACQKDM_26910, partial [Serratia proteamaculans]
LRWRHASPAINPKPAKWQTGAAHLVHSLIYLALVFTEINGRLGGCSHLDCVLRNLAGEDYLHTHTVLTRNRVPVNDLDAALAAANAMTHRRDGAGVVVLTEDLGGTGTIEYMTYARDENEAFSMERGFLDALALSPIEESVCE